MELLVKAGANPNIQDMDGRTPLHMTALHGFYLRTETLISQGGFGLVKEPASSVKVGLVLLRNLPN